MSQHRDAVSPRSFRQSGLSLVELMIAMALGLVLTLGVVQVFLGSSQTYRLSDALAKLQEDIRFSVGRLQYDIRMAGHAGCLVGEPTNHLDTSSSDYNSALWDSGRGVVGWEAPGTGLGDTKTITGFTEGGDNWSNGAGDTAPTAITDNAIAGTDFLVMSGAALADFSLSGNPSANANTLGTSAGSEGTGLIAGTIVFAVTEDCSGGDRYQKNNNESSGTLTRGNGANISPGNVMTLPFNEYSDEGSIYVYKSRAYFIGMGASEEPSLFMERLDPGDTSGAVELVEGVENMQLLYGVDDGVDRQADRYVTAADVTNWDEVVSVRMALLYRSRDRVAVDDEARTFNLAGVELTTQKDRRVRLVGQGTVGIRNRLE